MDIQDLVTQDRALRKSRFLGGIPSPGRPRRVILNTDAHNEIDDQMAIVHALLSPELKVEGIIAAHYGTHTDKDSMEQSYREIQHLLKLLGMEGKVQVLKGAPFALEKSDMPQKSEGAEFIISHAQASTEPLYVAFLGPLTDMASAYLMVPEVAERVVVLWIGGGFWPTGGPEFNAFNDWMAANVVFCFETSPGPVSPYHLPDDAGGRCRNGTFCSRERGHWGLPNFSFQDLAY